MGKILAGWLLLFSVALVSCRKDELPDLPTSNDPVFRITGDIDGIPVEFIAGLDGFELTSEKIVVNGVPQLHSLLSNGNHTFQLTFASGNLDQPESIAVNPATIPSWALTGYPAEPVLVIGKQHFSNAQNIQSLSWKVDGVQQAEELLIIQEPGVYNICLTVLFKNNKEEEICQEMILGYKKNARNHLRYLIGNDNHIIAFFDNPEDAIERVQWFINDSLIASEKLNLVIPVQQTRFKLSGIAHSANGTVREKTIFIDRSGQNQYIEDLTFFEYQSSINWDNKPRISIFHQGKTYRSIISSGNIVIDHVDDFHLPGNSAAYKKIRATYSGNIQCIEDNNFVHVNLIMTIALPDNF
jgi:hypothetical protein